MNIISNNCAGAACYKFVLNQPYNNPFVWCITDVVSLELYRKSINFNRIKLWNDNDLTGIWHITIDDKVDCKFIHAFFDKNASSIQIIQPTASQNAEIRSNRIWEYLVQTYFRRLQRMPLNEDPVYVLYNAPKTLERLNTVTDRIINVPVIDTGGIVNGIIHQSSYILNEIQRFK